MCHPYVQTFYKQGVLLKSNAILLQEHNLQNILQDNRVSSDLAGLKPREKSHLPAKLWHSARGQVLPGGYC